MNNLRTVATLILNIPNSCNYSKCLLNIQLTHEQKLGIVVHIVPVVIDTDGNSQELSGFRYGTGEMTLKFNQRKFNHYSINKNILYELVSKTLEKHNFTLQDPISTIEILSENLIAA